MVEKTRVLVTGVGGGGVGEQVVKTLRLRPDTYYIIGTDMTEYSMGLYQVDAKYLLPPAKDKNYIDKLLDICKRERAQVLVPGSEPELRVISENRKAFDILLLINTENAIRVCMNKWETYLALKMRGFAVPHSCILSNAASCTGMKLPAIVKPAIGGGGSFNCYMAQDQYELAFFGEYIRRQGIVPMAQEYIGTAEDEYTVGTLTDTRDGEMLGSIALRRQIMSGLSNRMRVPDRKGGKLLVVSSGISQGEFGEFADVRRECEKIAVAMGSRGAMNIQCRKHEGKVYAFEINPRLSGTTYMRAMVGVNEPDIWIRRNLYGEDIRLGEYKKGMVLRGLVERYIP